MAKHIHVFLGPKIRVATTDSPDWDESKHPRADNGQFGKGSGGGTKPQPGAGNLALKQRQEAKKQAHAQKMAQVNKQKTMMKGVGLTPAAAEKQKIARQQAQAGSTPPAPANVSGQGAAPSVPNWSASNGNWDKAKKEGRELVQAKLAEAKSGGDRTDALLALKKQAEVEHRKGSYLAAVVIGQVNDYFDRVK